MALTDKKRRQLESTVQPYLSEGEKVLGGATGTHWDPWWLWLITFIVPPLYLVTQTRLGKTWHLVVTDRRLLAVKVKGLRPQAEEHHLDTQSIPWDEIATLNIGKGLLTNRVTISTRAKEGYIFSEHAENFRFAIARGGNDLEALKEATKAAKPELDI